VLPVEAVSPTGGPDSTLVLEHETCFACTTSNRGCTSVLRGPLTEESVNLVETDRLASVEEDISFAAAQSGADLSGDGGDDLIMATLELDPSGAVSPFNGPIQGELGTADFDAVV
jgi:hypothetical protein